MLGAVVYPLTTTLKHLSFSAPVLSPVGKSNTIGTGRDATPLRWWDFGVRSSQGMKRRWCGRSARIRECWKRWATHNSNVSKRFFTWLTTVARFRARKSCVLPSGWRILLMMYVKLMNLCNLLLTSTTLNLENMRIHEVKPRGCVRTSDSSLRELRGRANERRWTYYYSKHAQQLQYREMCGAHRYVQAITREMFGVYVGPAAVQALRHMALADCWYE